MADRMVEAARCVVVKVGSRVLLSEPSRLDALVAQVAALHADGRQVVLVSSGAIARGVERLGLDARPKKMAALQAAAAIGQGALMAAYSEAFGRRNVHVGQVLLTHADLASRERFLNVRQAFEGLFAVGAVPVVNENDCVAVDEIRFGDNDQLAAMVTTALGADLLILLSDVEGVLDTQGQRLSVLRPDDDVDGWIRPPKDDVGSGGMASKVRSAREATARGATVVIACGEEANVVPRIVGGEDIGTLVVPKDVRLSSRKAWIGFTLRPKGRLHVDAGAAEAMRTGASLLAAGVVDVEGTFGPQAPVEVVGPNGILARGLCRLDDAQVRAQLGAQGALVLHRDDLVMLER